MLDWIVERTLLIHLIAHWWSFSASGRLITTIPKMEQEMVNKIVHVASNKSIRCLLKHCVLVYVRLGTSLFQLRKTGNVSLAQIW